MGLKATTELIDLELAVDSLLIRHPEHGRAYKDLLNLWGDIGRWMDTVRDPLSANEGETLNFLIADEEQLSVYGAKRGEFKLKLLGPDADYRLIDPSTDAGKDELKTLLRYVGQYGALLGISIWQIEFGVRPNLPHSIDTVRNRLYADIMPRYRKGNLYCPRGKLVPPDVGTATMVNYKGIFEIYWNNEGIFKAQVVLHDDGSFNLLDADLDLEIKFRGTRYDRR